MGCLAHCTTRFFRQNLLNHTAINLKPLKVPKDTDHHKSAGNAKKVALSAREAQILDLLAKGLTNKDIATHLFISPFTAKRHTENIYRKLDVHNRIELFQKARKSKLI